MRRALIGAAAGLAVGGFADWWIGAPELGVSSGALVAITIWFWAGRGQVPGVESGGRRG